MQNFDFLMEFSMETFMFHVVPPLGTFRSIFPSLFPQAPLKCCTEDMTLKGTHDQPLRTRAFSSPNSLNRSRGSIVSFLLRLCG